MLKKTITYTDYNGTEWTEDFYFNISKAELMDMEMGINGGMSTMINKIIATHDNAALYKLFTDLITKAYGEKSLDGKRFVKSKELSDSFVQTEAYSALLDDFLSNSESAAAFVNGILPKLDNKTLPSSN